jgi:hypothetical protein
VIKYGQQQWLFALDGVKIGGSFIGLKLTCACFIYSKNSYNILKSLLSNAFKEVAQ